MYTPEISFDLLATSSEWISEAACRSSDVDMLQDRPSSEQYEVCAVCAVFDKCREELLSIDPDEIAGVWAGLSNAQWKELRRERKKNLR
jgi:hypothetical protein